MPGSETSAVFLPLADTVSNLRTCLTYERPFLPFYPLAVPQFALSFFTTCGAVASPLHGATPERRAMAYAAKPLVALQGSRYVLLHL